MKEIYWLAKQKTPCMNSDKAGIQGSNTDIGNINFNFHSIFFLVSFYRKSPSPYLGKWMPTATDADPPGGYW